MHYNTIYGVTFLISIIKAIVCFLTMVGYLGISEFLWLLVLTLESVILVFCTVISDPQFPPKSPNHNVYRIYIISLLAMILTVWFFMVFAVYGLVIAEVALMTYLLFCLPIWLTFIVSFFGSGNASPRVHSVGLLSVRR
jgi:hypothetical protein